MDFFSKLFNAGAALPGSPEAVIRGIYGGFNGDYSWNPYGSGVGVGDVIGGGTRESQDPEKRRVGRAAGTAVGAAFGLPALASWAGGGTSSASGLEGYAAQASAAESGGAYGMSSNMGAMGAGGYYGDPSAAGYDPGYTGAYDGYMGDPTALGYDPGAFGGEVAPGASQGGLWDNVQNWMKRRYSTMTAKDMWRMGMGAYGLMNTLSAQRQVNGSIDVTSHPMYANMMESAMRQARAGGYQGSPMMAAVVAGKSADLYQQMYMEQQQRAANKMGATYGSLSALGLLGSGFLGG